MNWFYELLNITKINKDTLPSYKNKNLPEKQNEAVVRKRKLTMKESKDALKALGLYYIKMSLPITTHTYYSIR